MNQFKQCLLPAIVFQTIVIAGGYGTGQEFVQFFLCHGPVEGILGLLVAASCWSVVCMLSFNCARIWKSYDYRTFFKHLLGKHWVLFEISYIVLIFVVLSIVAASIGSLGKSLLNIPYNIGILILIAAVSYCAFVGSKFIEKLFSVWSFFLMTVYFVLLAYCFTFFSKDIIIQLQTPTQNLNWLVAGIQYAGYNLGLIPAVFFSLRYIKTKKQAYIAGGITGIWAILPGILFYIAMLGQYPQIMDQPVPSAFLLQKLNFPILTIFFAIALFGTLIETGIGLIHAINFRIEVQLKEQNKYFPKRSRVIIGLGLLAGAMAMAQLGLAELISRGYGILTWVIIAVYVLPLLHYSRMTK
jgi:uncharacterized membrane protein YkvI